MDKYRSEISRIVNLYNEVEGLVKTYELRQFEVMIPAINELRYAGRRAFDILNLGSNVGEQQDVDSRVASYLLDAEHCCVRAKHDIIDSLVMYGLAKLEAVERRYNISDIIETFPNYLAKKQVLFEAREKIIKSRENRELRVSIYDDIYKCSLPEMLEFVDFVDNGVEKLSEGSRRSQWFKSTYVGFGFSILLGIFGVIVSIVAIITSLSK